MEDDCALIATEKFSVHLPLDDAKETLEKDDIKDVFEEAVLQTGVIMKSDLESSTEEAAQNQNIDFKFNFKVDEGLESGKEDEKKVNVDDDQKLNHDHKHSSQSSSSNGSISPENISPDCGKISPLDGKLSTDIGKVSLEDGKVSPDNDQISQQNGKVSPENVQNSQQNGKISPENGQISNQNGKISPENGRVSPQNSTFSPESGRVSPLNIKVSPDSVKMSPPVSPQMVVRFSNCSQETGSDLPSVENDTEDEGGVQCLEDEEGVECLEDDNKENIFKKGGDESPKWEDPDSEEDTGPVRSSARSSSYLAPLQKKLRKACREGDKATLSKILQENPGIKLDLMDEEGSTCLNDSVTKSCQFEDVTKLLLEAGAGVGVQDQLGNTPLHNAVLYYPATEETIQMLLDRGADTNIRNYDGATPISMADDKDLKKVMRLLSKSKGAKSGAKVAPNKRILSFGGASGAASPADIKIVVAESPGTPSILKKSGGAKRKRDDVEEEEEGEEGNVKRRRIKFNEKEASVRLFCEDE